MCIVNFPGKEKMPPGQVPQYNSRYGYGQRQQPPDDSIMGRVIQPNIVVFGIIAACVAAFAIEMIDLQATAQFWMWPDYPMPWMFVTSVFLHGDFSHIFFNMFMLYMFGMTLERMIGHKMFLALFLIAGVVGNIGYVAYCWASGDMNPAVGASGAIYGVFACLAILAPQIRVYLFFFLPLKIIHALVLYAAIDILFLNSNDSVAHAAHIAGLLVGLAFAMYLKKKIMEAQAYRVSYKFDAGY